MSSLRASRVRTVNDKMRWTSHSSFVIVASVACVRTVNDKYDGQAIQVLSSLRALRVCGPYTMDSHSSFIIIASVTCVRTVNGNFTAQ